MNLKAADIIASIIQVMYPGGLQGFHEALGGFMFLPEPIDLIVIKMPIGGVDSGIVKQISKVSENVEYLDIDNFSFDPDHLSEVESLIAEWLQEELKAVDLLRAVVKATPIANVVSLSTVDKDSAIAQKIESYLKTIEGHGLTFIVYKGGSYSRVRGYTPTQTAVKPEETKRETVLTDDDILNLKIALGSAETVEDFLKSI